MTTLLLLHSLWLVSLAFLKWTLGGKEEMLGEDVGLL